MVIKNNNPSLLYTTQIDSCRTHTFTHFTAKQIFTNFYQLKLITHTPTHSRLTRNEIIQIYDPKQNKLKKLTTRHKHAQINAKLT